MRPAAAAEGVYSSEPNASSLALSCHPIPFALQVCQAVGLIMVFYTGWLLVARHLSDKAMGLKEAQLQSKNAFVSYV